MNKHGFFDKIDEYFAGKKQTDFYFVAIAVFASIVFIAYLYAFKPAEKMYKSSRLENKTILKMLNDEKFYVNRMSKDGDNMFYINGLKNEIIVQKNRLAEAKQTNAYVDKKLRELSYLLFDDKNWANFLNSITKTAKQYGVKVSEISNELNKSDMQKVEQILNAHVKMSGDFHGIMKFVNSLEESMLIVDIYNINLEGKRDIEGDIDIAVWGMKY